MDLSKAITRVGEEISEMSDEEFYKKLQEHENGDLAKALAREFVQVCEEGDECPFCSKGTLLWEELEGCTCHLGRPPCSACVNRQLECDACGWKAE